MVNASMRQMVITLPDAIVTQYGLATNTLTLNILADAQINGGKRAIVRNLRDANASDAGRIRRVSWGVGGERNGVPVGAVGASVESQAGYLGIDWCRDLDSRWDSRLISAGAEVSVTLTGFDPPAATSGYFAGFTFGTNTFGNLSAPFTPTIAGSDVVVFDEQAGYLFAHRGILSTQISLATWTVIATAVQPAVVRDADNWRANGYVAVGPTAPMQRRVAASASGAVYEDTVSVSPAGNVYASAVKVGSDRAWFIDAAHHAVGLFADVFNYACYTLDRFATLAAPFQVGDPDVGVTGILPFGPFTGFGSQKNIYDFTDQGKPVPKSRALIGFASPMNGKQGADPGWGWNYVITAIGLRAMQPGVDNPVGIGERMRGFTGHNGAPTAVWANRGELWVVYQTAAGDLYGYRGTFGPQTAGTGQPLMFPWFYAAAQDCDAIFSSNTPTYPAIIRGAGTNMTHQIISADGRDDLDPNYVYSTGGGTAWLTTMDRDPQLLKTFRLARIRTRGMTAGSSWTLAVGFDTIPQNPVGSTYATIGAVTTNGFSVVTATAGGADGQGNPTPTANISGRTLKPRLVQVAAGSGAATTPPEIDALELEYDERPDQIEEIAVVVNIDSTRLTDNALWTVLQAIVGSQTSGPFGIQLPDDLPPGVAGSSGGGKKYGMINSITKRDDVKDDSIEGVQVTISVWPQASALTSS